MLLLVKHGCQLGPTSVGCRVKDLDLPVHPLVTGDNQRDRRVGGEQQEEQSVTGASHHQMSHVERKRSKWKTNDSIVMFSGFTVKILILQN